MKAPKNFLVGGPEYCYKAIKGICIQKRHIKTYWQLYWYISQWPRRAPHFLQKKEGKDFIFKQFQTILPIKIYDIIQNGHQYIKCSERSCTTCLTYLNRHTQTSVNYKISFAHSTTQHQFRGASLVLEHWLRQSHFMVN